MKSYEWWLKQKKRIRKKYSLVCGMYLSPGETKNFVKRLKRKKNDTNNNIYNLRRFYYLWNNSKRKEKR